MQRMRGRGVGETKRVGEGEGQKVVSYSRVGS